MEQLLRVQNFGLSRDGYGAGEHQSLERPFGHADPGQLLARALDLRAPLEPSPATAAVVALLRSSGIEGPGPDRHLSPEIETAVQLVASGAVLKAAEDVIGDLA